MAAVINMKRRTDADMLRSYIVKLDGKKVHKLRYGESVSLEVVPGKHSLFLTIDWCRSNKVKFEIRDTEELNFECGNTFFSMPYLVLLYISLLRHKYLWMEQAEVCRNGSPVREQALKIPKIVEIIPLLVLFLIIVTLVIVFGWLIDFPLWGTVTVILSIAVGLLAGYKLAMKFIKSMG